MRIIDRGWAATAEPDQRRQSARRGELLSLQWRDVNLDRGELTIRGEKAKDGDTRLLPISARLVAVLTMAKTDPAGDDYKPSDFVFGEVGKQEDGREPTVN